MGPLGQRELEEEGVDLDDVGDERRAREGGAERDRVAVPDEGLAARRAEALAIAVHVDIRQLLHHSALPAPRPAARDVTQPHARSGRVPNFAPVEGNHAERRAFVLFD